VDRTSAEHAVRILRGFQDFPAEVQAIGADLETRFHRAPDSVVVLARRRRLLEDAAAILNDRGISALVAQRKDQFESPPVVWIHSMLRLANDHGNEQALEAVAGTFEQLTGIATDPKQISVEAAAAGSDYLKRWLRTIQDKTDDATVRRVISEATHHLADTPDVAAFNAIALEWVAQAVAQVRVNASASEAAFNGYENEIETWTRLVGEIDRAYHRHMTIEAFLHELQMRSKEPLMKPHTVELMTIHVAKGKEFKHVYLIGMVDDEIPSFQSLKRGEKSPEMEEERRNCFVAITRTIETLTLSYARTYYGWGKRPSRFLREMGLKV
jgi:DNA helicase II / ATP-dependent DNA helicase PcrA